MNIKYIAIITLCALLTSCYVFVAPGHDDSAVKTIEFPEHVSRFSFANVPERDSKDFDKPGAIRMALRMRNKGSMNIELEQAKISHNNGPWITCVFRSNPYDRKDHGLYTLTTIQNKISKYPHKFNILIVSPSVTYPANRSNGYEGLDPMKHGLYRLNVTYKINGKKFEQMIDLKLSRYPKVYHGVLLGATST
jgi:hypothetical protein